MTKMFRFIYPNYSELEMDNSDLVLSKIEAELDRFTVPVFEEITRQFLIALNRQGKLPFTFGKIGRQWGRFRGEPGKNTYEIDLAALKRARKRSHFENSSGRKGFAKEVRKFPGSRESLPLTLKELDAVEG